MHVLRLEYKADMAHYKAGTLVLAGCIDDRFAKMFDKFVESLEQEGSIQTRLDRVILAGGAWNLAEDGSVAQEVLMEQITISRKLHETGTLTVVTHEDCGAAGEEAQCGGDRREQFLVHLDRHHKINAAIRVQFPDMENIRNFYLSKNGVIELDLSKEEVSDEEVEAVALAA